MKMTIADNIDFLNEAKKLFEDIANNPGINETVKAYFTIESLESAIEVMRKYQIIQKVLEKVWNIPSCMLDEAECLNEIMETYRTVR